MATELDTIIAGIDEEFKSMIGAESRNYLEVNIGNRAEALGYAELKEKFKDACAIVPLRHPVKGMKVRIDGRTFVQYAQFDSGLAVPGYVARESQRPHRRFVARDSMILNFA